jgi:hypothetical protein
MRLMPGDELRLRYVGDPSKLTWSGVGHVVKVPNSRIVTSHRRVQCTARFDSRLWRRGRHRTENQSRRARRVHGQFRCRVRLEIDVVRSVRMKTARVASSNDIPGHIVF